jgi:hypothetical protein
MGLPRVHPGFGEDASRGQEHESLALACGMSDTFHGGRGRHAFSGRGPASSPHVPHSRETGTCDTRALLKCDSAAVACLVGYITDLRDASRAGASN